MFALSLKKPSNPLPATTDSSSCRLDVVCLLFISQVHNVTRVCLLDM